MNWKAGYVSIALTLSMVFLIVLNVSCQENDDVLPLPPENGGQDGTPTAPDYKLAEIDLSHWKVTLPIGRPSDGKPTEVYPPNILEYATDETLKPFMYNDSINGAITFYTYPDVSTANSSYSRTELRELMEPNSTSVNWTFKEGGRMKGTLSIPEISIDDNGKQHRTIIMQIHGRLTNEQRDLIGQKDNNAPPMLKIYYTYGYVRVKTKYLKDTNATYEELLQTDAWGDAEGHTFDTYVGTDKFTLEVIVSDGRMEVVLNDQETVVYDDIHMEKWGVFENYFKAGNYLVSKDEDAFAKVNYYDLVVTH